MEFLQAGVDRSVIALWLGHESIEMTQIYLDADLALKEQALAKTTPANVKNTGRYRPDDNCWRFLRAFSWRQDYAALTCESMLLQAA
jgi:integrase/recombinase XerD